MGFEVFAWCKLGFKVEIEHFFNAIAIGTFNV